MPLIIDGYNLLRTIQKTDEEFEQLDETGLCRFLSQYLTRVRDHGHVFFDGLGPPDKTGMAGLAGLEVYFSGQDREADELIEQKIQDNTAPRRLVVVSTDRRVRQAASKKKATAMLCEVFWIEMQRRLAQQQVVYEPKEKRQGITEMETDQWLDAFGLD
ncbi:MAG: NYN domain-containing protein [Sedimentisphaerales bacterium]|nr:NYN domain-containing protein [Sedimentisphaerales bacterium]